MIRLSGCKLRLIYIHMRGNQGWRHPPAQGCHQPHAGSKFRLTSMSNQQLF